MASRGYTTPALVGQELGVTFTTAQSTQCDGLISEAEVAIDRYVGRAWLVGPTITDPQRPAVGDRVYTTAYPVAAVSSVQARSPAIGAPWTTLVAGSSYELLDAARGVVRVAGWPPDVVINTTTPPDPNTLYRVTYTVANPLPVPLDVQTAATLIVAERMGRQLAPVPVGASSVSVAQGDVAVDYRDPPASADGASAFPAAAVAILAGYRGLVFA